MRPIALAAAVALFAAPIAAGAHLSVGAKAPNFQTQGALGGKAFNVSLSNALKKGPVVLYFYPKAFTQGCTLEAHEFAERSPDFTKAGATVIGMSADNIDDLKRFSVEACRDKFAVAIATPAVIKAYDVKMPSRPNMPAQMANLTSRTSYVIAPNGRVIFVHNDLDYKEHVKNTLAAVQRWKAAQRGK